MNALTLLFCLAVLWFRFHIDLSRSGPVVDIAVLHGLYLAFFVNEQNVFQAARLYARQLLLSIDKLNGRTGQTTATRSQSRAKEEG
ncbi:hypothetical protein Q2941_40390 [Bradyrhizobium sp. UFLA05-153]